MHPVLLFSLLLFLCHFCDVQNSSVSWNCTFSSPTTTVLCAGEKVNATTALWLEDSDLPPGIGPGHVDTLILSVPSLYVITELSVPFLNLQYLNFWNSGVSHVSTDAFKTLGSQLTGLSLSDNAFTSVPKTAFKGTPQILFLSLSNNTITSLESEDFAGLTNITNLSLRNNTISRIANGTFAHLATIVSLDLSLNRLTAFNTTRVGLGSCTASVSTSCSLLESLNLRQNRLSGTEMVLHLPLLQQLDLSQNAIRKLSFFDSQKSSLRSLIVLDLSRNRITYLDMDNFVTLTKLQQLDLSQNEITMLHDNAFLGLSSLRKLYLSENELTYLSANHTQDLSSLEAANFSDNSIEYLFFGAFANSPHLNSVIFTGNPLECSCELYTFAGLLKTFSDDSISSATCDESTTKVVEFDFTSLNCLEDHTSMPPQPATTTMLPTISSTEKLTTVSDPPTTSTLALSSFMDHTATDLTTVKQLMDDTPPKKFDGYMEIVHIEQTNNTIQVFFSGHGLELPGKQINCSVSAGVLGYSRNNTTVWCPRNGENRTVLVSYLDSKRDYEICLLAFDGNNMLVRNCTVFNSTILSMSNKKATLTPLTTRATLVTTTTEEDQPTTKEDSLITRLKTSATTVTSTDATMQPTTDATMQPTTDATMQPTTEDKYNITAPTVLVNVTLPSTETRGAGISVHTMFMFVALIPAREKLVVNWEPSDFSRYNPSLCNFTITVLENNITITRSEVLCSPGRQIDIKVLDWCNNYHICLRSRNFDSICHSITPAKLGMKCTKNDVSVSAISGASGSGVGFPISLMIVIAALVLTAVVLVIIIVLRRRRTHVVTRKKSSEGSTTIRMQVNRRSGSYMVNVADDLRTVNDRGSLQTFGKVSHRSSSIDEL